MGKRWIDTSMAVGLCMDWELYINTRGKQKIDG